MTLAPSLANATKCFLKYASSKRCASRHFSRCCTIVFALWSGSSIKSRNMKCGSQFFFVSHLRYTISIVLDLRLFYTSVKLYDPLSVLHCNRGANQFQCQSHSHFVSPIIHNDQKMACYSVPSSKQYGTQTRWPSCRMCSYCHTHFLKSSFFCIILNALSSNMSIRPLMFLNLLVKMKVCVK